MNLRAIKARKITFITTGRAEPCEIFIYFRFSNFIGTKLCKREKNLRIRWRKSIPSWHSRTKSASAGYHRFCRWARALRHARNCPYRRHRWWGGVGRVGFWIYDQDACVITKKGPEPKDQYNFTDPESAIMKTGSSGF